MAHLVVKDEPKSDKLRRRFAVLAELRQLGTSIHFFRVTPSGFERQLAKLLDVSPTELAQLDATIDEARTQVLLAQRATARTERSSDGKKLLVSVPGLDPRASGSIYDRFLARLEATLGPERFEVFRQMTEGSLGNVLDQFGLNSVTYEVTLEAKPEWAGGPPIIHWSRTSSDLVSHQRSTSVSQTDFTSLQKNDPLLAGLLLPELQKAR